MVDEVDPLQIPLLGLDEGNGWIGRVEGQGVAVGAQRSVPVAVADALHVEGAGRPVERPQVLRAAEDVVEGLAVVERELVELRDRQVGEVPPSRALVEGLVEARVGPGQDVCGVGGVDPEGVVVAVLLAAGAQFGEGRAAVAGDVHEDVHLVDHVHVVRRRFDLLVVVGTGAARDVGIAVLPALGAVCGAVEAAFAGAGLDGGVDHVAVRRRDVDADLAHIAIGEPGGHAPPCAPPVGGLVDAGAGAARQERPDAAPPLVGGRVHDLGIHRIELDVGDAGVLIYGEDRFPAVAAVFAAIEAALPACRPEGTLGRDEHDVPVARIDQDLADVFRGCEAHVLPCAAAVPAPVDPVAPRHVPPAHVFARADPHNVGIGRVDGDVADGIRGVIVEDRGPGGARVRGLPDAAGADSDVPGGGVAGVDRDVGDAAAHQGRADSAEREVGGGFGDDGGVGWGLGVKPGRRADVGKDGQWKGMQGRPSRTRGSGSGWGFAHCPVSVQWVGYGESGTLEECWGMDGVEG